MKKGVAYSRIINKQPLGMKKRLIKGTLDRN